MNRLLAATVFAAAYASLAGADVGPKAPDHLTVERLADPVGIESRAPRFGWWIGDGFVRQKKYRILVASSLEKLEADEGDLWDSGVVQSDDSVDVSYAGVPLGDSRRAWWKVQVSEWQGGGLVVSPWSRPARFTTGTRDWRAKWIGGADPSTDAGAPAFRKRFAVKDGLREATLHVTGLGFHELELNGRRLDSRRLDPPYTDYTKRVLYSTYLVEKMLKTGVNTIEVRLGRGWFDCPPSGVWCVHEAKWIASPRLLAQLELKYDDGSSDLVVSDSSWTEVGNPVRFDCVRKGETIAPPENIERPARVVDAPKGRLEAAQVPPTVVVREMPAARVVNFADGTATVDFGEDIAGFARVRLKGLSAGAELTFRYDELCGRDLRPLPAKDRHIACFSRKTEGGRLVEDPENFQLDRYVASGGAEETYEPHFTPKGFRYLHVSGLASPMETADAVALVLSTDFRKVGSFVCSSDGFNTVLEMADRAYRSNFVNGYPTDCPHREKNGWTGDANIAGEMAQYVYENTAAYEHWLRECAAEAHPVTGRVPRIVPNGGWPQDVDGGTGPIWDGVIVRLTRELVRYRGDKAIFAELEPAMRRYADDYEQFIDERGDMPVGYGDWSSSTPGMDTAITTVAYFADVCDTLGKDDIAAELRKAAVRNHYRGAGVWDRGEQTALACALNYGLVPESERPATEGALVEAVRRAKDHVDFGLCGSKEVFRALSEAGRTDLAFRMATQTDYPSFLHWRALGATSFCESWSGEHSRNHVMFADVVAWAYQYLAGIRGVREGFKRFELSPDIVDELDFVEAKTETPYGVVESAWRRIGDGIVYRFSIPPNTAARVSFGGRVRTYAAGTYELRCRKEYTGK